MIRVFSSFLVAATIIIPEATFADFSLNHEGRNLIGAPISFAGSYLFVTCNGVPVPIPDGATITFSSEFSCNFEVHPKSEVSILDLGAGTFSNFGHGDGVQGSGVAQNTSNPRVRNSSGVATGWTVPIPVTNNPPCEGGGGITPSPNFDIDQMANLYGSINNAIRGLSKQPAGNGYIPGLTNNDTVMMWSYDGQYADVGSNSPLIIETDIARAMASVLEEASKDCEDPVPSTPTGCPGCSESLRLYIESNDNWRDLWWENDTSALQDYYSSMADAAGVTPEMGKVIGDDYLLKYQFTNELFQGNIVAVDVAQ